MKITKLNIEGFRSLRNVCWLPGDLNVIIGPNGTGKSNLLRFLELIAISAQGKLSKYIQSLGGMDPIVWDGIVTSIKFSMETTPEGGEIGPEQYNLELVRLGSGSSYKVEKELLTNFLKVRRGEEKNPFKFLERHAKTAVIFDEKARTFTTLEEFISDEESLLSIASGPFINNHFIPPFQNGLASIAVYHDLHTNKDASIRQPAIARLEKRVDPDGQNLISVIHTLYTSDRDFKNDINSAMQAAFGDDFEELVFPPASDQRIQLRIRWKSLKREQSAAELSDGTLRFLFLLTVLASPSPAPVIAIDEPETGLHPSMLPIVAEYAIEASTRSQVILTTHSPQFLDAFVTTRPTTTIAKWQDGETVLKTLSGDELDYWLKEYSLGALFKSGELEQMG
ncbi:AAA family ATPase [candidate division KSB1 bacterium]|nr:AAA family ATPase [candidate division KSB1 bacterium]